MTIHKTSQETQMAVLVERQRQIDEHLEINDAAIKALQDERNSALKWGIITLGAGIVAMGSWIFNLFAKHLQ